jgi:hypothetical protein
VTNRTLRFSRTRTSARLLALFLVGLAPVAFASPASAQSSAEDPTTAMARARFKEGVEFYDKAEYEQARAAFLQAYALKKHPAVLLNLAWSCLKSGHALEAERYFKQFLSEGREITEKQRADANDGLNQSHAKLGRIEVSAPTGTEVTIDGERVGTTPISDLISVEAGAHTVKFKGADGMTETDSVSVLGGEKVVARFARAAAPPAAAATPPPQAPAADSPLPPPPVSKSSDDASSILDQRPPKKESIATESHAGGRGLFSPPRNVVPVIVLGVLAVGGAATAVIAGVYFKGQAQDNANQTASAIQTAAQMMGTNAQGICNHPTGRFVQACTDFSNDNNDVNLDATVGNIAIAAGAAAAAGALLYWMFADKAADDGSTASRPVVTPSVGRSFGGLTISGQF